MRHLDLEAVRDRAAAAAGGCHDSTRAHFGADVPALLGELEALRRELRWVTGDRDGWAAVAESNATAVWPSW